MKERDELTFRRGEEVAQRTFINTTKVEDKLFSRALKAKLCRIARGSQPSQSRQQSQGKGFVDAKTNGES